MSAPSPHIKVKLIVSYVIFLVILFATLLFIYQKVRTFTSVDQNSALQTDSIIRLVEEKDQRMLDLVQSIAELNEHFITTNQDLEKYLIDSSESPIVQKKTVTIHDTIISKDTNKRLIERLADAFSPKEENQTIEVKTRVETQLDTVYDSMNRAALEQLQSKLRKERNALKARQKRTVELQNINEQMTLEIDSLLHHYEQTQINNLLQQVENENLNKEKAFQWISIIAIASIVIIIIFSLLLLKDINKNNRYRMALENANKRSEDLLLAREKLMLTITHDIKAPVGTIMGYLELMRSTSLTKEQLEYLSSIDVASEHISKLIHDLLDYHLLDLNKMELQKDNFLLLDFIEEILESFAPLYQKKGLELSANFKESELEKWVVSDSLRLKQILNNLLSNALKFTDQGGVELKVTLDEARLIFKVKDTGKGMNEEDIQRIFKEFTRLASAQGKEGFGLGLSIVSKIVTAMGGLIDVESKLGKGTIFTVIIPYENGVEEDIHYADISKSSKNTKLLEGMKIVLMDDDQLQLKLMKSVLERASAEVTLCHSLNKLLSLLDEESFDLLITDIQMPEITGFDLVCLLRNSNKDNYKNIPIIAVSAQEQFDVSLLEESGVLGVLNKPFNAKDVYEIMSQELSTELDVDDATILELKRLDRLVAFLEDADISDKIEIFESFITETRYNLIKLREGLEDKNLENVAKTCHKMLPVMKILQLEELCDALIYLDQRKITYSYEDCEIKVNFILKEISKLVDEAQLCVASLKGS